MLNQQLSTCSKRAQFLLAAATILATQSAFCQYFVDDPNFGTDQIYVDTNGLGWLNLNNSYGTGLTINQVIAETAAGGTYAGFRYASQGEFKDLFESEVGATLPDYLGLSYSVSNSAINPLLEVLGTTESIDLLGGFDGPLLGTWDYSEAVFSNGYIIGMGASDFPSLSWSVNDARDNEFTPNFGPDDGLRGNSSHFLVTDQFLPVPEPATVGLLAISGLGAILLIRRKLAVRVPTSND